MSIRAKIAGAALALAAIGGGVAVTATPAHADYVAFGGVSMIDTQRVQGGALSSCDAWGTTGDADIDCYTWLRTNGVARRGSPADYFVEASNGFVFSLCSSGWRLVKNNSWATTPTDADYYGQIQNPFRYNWVAQPGRSVYCTSPTDPAGGASPYNGFAWPDIPNANNQ